MPRPPRSGWPGSWAWSTTSAAWPPCAGTQIAGRQRQIRKEVADAIKALQNAGQSPDGFVVAWMLSGPYDEEGKPAAELFDVAFARRNPAAKPSGVR